MYVKGKIYEILKKEKNTKLALKSFVKDQISNKVKYLTEQVAIHLLSIIFQL